MIKIEDIIFWILIIAIIAIALWLISGSPPEIDALITMALIIVASELVIWRKIYTVENNFNLKLSKIDKNTAIGFAKVKHDIEKMNIEMNNRFDLIENKLNNIDNKLGKII